MTYSRKSRMVGETCRAGGTISRHIRKWRNCLRAERSRYYYASCDTCQLILSLTHGAVKKAIGVSNHSVPFLTKLLKETTVVPAVNQIERHPLLPQDDVVALCKKEGIVVTAYSALGSSGGPLLKEEKVLKVAEKHGVSAGTVLLNYHSTWLIPSSILFMSADENS